MEAVTVTNHNRTTGIDTVLIPSPHILIGADAANPTAIPVRVCPTPTPDAFGYSVAKVSVLRLSTGIDPKYLIVDEAPKEKADTRLLVLWQITVTSGIQVQFTAGPGTLVLAAGIDQAKTNFSVFEVLAIVGRGQFIDASMPFNYPFSQARLTLNSDGTTTVLFGGTNLHLPVDRTILGELI